MQKCGLTHRQIIQTSPRRISCRVPWLKWSEFNQSGEMYRISGNLQRWVWPTQWALCMKLSLGDKIFPTRWEATHWDIQSLCFGGRCTLLQSGMADFVLCDGIMQRAHSHTFITCHFADTLTNSWQLRVWRPCKEKLDMWCLFTWTDTWVSRNKSFPKVDKEHQRAGSRRRF